MSPMIDPTLWERLTRYTAGACDAKEAAQLSRLMESNPEVAAALAEILLQAVAIRDDAEAHPELPQAAGSTSRSPKLRGWAPVLLTVAASVAVAFMVWQFVPSLKERAIGQVVAVDGAVRWTGGGGKVRDGLQVGASLPGGLIEAMSDDSTITVAFTDRTAVTLFGHSSATFSDDGQKHVHLREGGLSANVQPQPRDKPMLIHTPTALLEVLGTQLEVDSDPSTTRLTVNEGRVRMTRLLDGRVAEVPAQHALVASLERTADMKAVPRNSPGSVWRVDFTHLADGLDVKGAWLPADDTHPVRIAARPVFIQKSSRGPVTIHSVNIAVPWKNLETVQVQTGSRIRVRGYARAEVPLEIMLGGKKPRGGFAGLFFREAETRKGAWQIEMTASDFRKGHAAGSEPPPPDMELREIAIYTINTDAGLEVESVEVLRE